MTNLEDKNFNDNVLHKIKEEKISPKPRWQFLLKNILIWGLGVVSLILGAIATSLVFYMITGEDAGVGRGGANPFEALLFVIPFFWLICLAVFAIMVYFYIKHTKKGYKYSTKKIILFIIGASLLLGVVVSVLGLDRIIDDTLGERAPFYDRVINPRLEYWANPEQGRLTGMVISQTSPIEYNLIDPRGENWVVILTSDEDYHDKILVDHPVRLIGQRTAEHRFVIKEVMSVGPGRGFLRRMMPPKVPHNCQLDSGSVCNIQPIIIQGN